MNEITGNAATTTTSGSNAAGAYDVEAVRRDFPVLGREVYGKPLVYLDTGASAQKPTQVIRAMTEAMENYYSNVHRGVHKLSQEATDAFEAGRLKTAELLNAGKTDEIVFVRGATEGINLVAHSWGRQNVGAGDEILISEMEHHANIVPWQLLAQEVGAVIKPIPIDDEGNLKLDVYAELLGPKTKVVAITHVSNALGTINPIKQIIDMAHSVGAKVMVDGCQAVPHSSVDVVDMDADFYVFSGHKLYGPTGIGALYGKWDLLDAMPPYQGGGEMIDIVKITESTYKAPPHRFEAGTPAIVEVIGLGAAIDYLNGLGFENIGAYEHGLLAYATERLEAIEGLEIQGKAKDKAALLSFTLAGAHAHDVGTILDRAGIAVRAGHHCAQPVMQHFNVPATARASFGLYNTRDEVDRLVDGITLVKEMFG
ncbi:MAG: SufS family cysteine desulfurase [Magnetovibrionaceae bacterium]